MKKVIYALMMIFFTLTVQAYGRCKDIFSLRYGLYEKTTKYLKLPD